MTSPTSTLLLLAILATLTTFLRQRTHFLTALLAIEAALLLLATAIPINQILYHLPNSTLIILILTLAACEASLGLALLVLMVRAYGNDLIRSLAASKL
jgi:NADH:ubiquinone oxidoreductase subunit K